VAEQRDRPLARRVDERDRAALRLRAEGRLDPNAEPRKLVLRAAAELVVAERRQERALAGERGQHTSGDRPATGGLRPGLLRVSDVAGGRKPLDADEIDPFHVPDDCDPHAAVSHLGTLVRFNG